MKFLNTKEKLFLKNISELTFCNPFLPRRIELEHELLGKSDRSVPTVWSCTADDDIFENAKLITKELFPLAQKLRSAIADGETFTDDQLSQYEDLALYYLYDKYRDKLNDLLADRSPNSNHTQCKEQWAEFLSDFNFYAVESARSRFTLLKAPEHLWACCFQIRRLFHYVFSCIVGTSVATIRLRAAIWQSVLTHNLRRYIRSLYDCMGNISTLITGPSGTGKELVARAIAMAQYVPFDSRKGEFKTDYSSSWLAMHLAAMSPTLIESEMFGHRKGAFTGATEDRKGMFETCLQYGTVFLDEIGELNKDIQVKLLRVLQNRKFQRLGEMESRDFSGKIVAATNRNFDQEMQEGNFRQDLYYRLCSDMIQTPSLAEQLADQPKDLKGLVNFLSQQLCPLDHESLTNEVVDWIDSNLGMGYGWPGNVRELEQCLRNIMIHGHYRPANQPVSGIRDQIRDQFLSCSLTAEELLTRYCTMVYAQTGSYEESARRLKIDRRTVKSKIDEALLKSFTSP